MASETILIVDDDRAIGRMTELWVRHLGYRTILVHDGASALATVAARRPDTILLDIRMPDMNGFEVSRRLRQDRELADVPIIFISANRQEFSAAESAACGAHAFIEKPFDLDRLKSELDRALRSGGPSHPIARVEEGAAHR